MDFADIYSIPYNQNKYFRIKLLSHPLTRDQIKFMKAADKISVYFCCANVISVSHFPDCLQHIATGYCMTLCSVMLQYAAFLIWFSHIWACGVQRADLMSVWSKFKRWSNRNKNSGELPLSKYILFAEPRECNTRVRRADKAKCTLTSPTVDPGTID